jgi:hypothetical protein
MWLGVLALLCICVWGVWHHGKCHTGASYWGVCLSPLPLFFLFLVIVKIVH